LAGPESIVGGLRSMRATKASGLMPGDVWNAPPVVGKPNAVWPVTYARPCPSTATARATSVEDPPICADHTTSGLSPGTRLRTNACWLLRLSSAELPIFVAAWPCRKSEDFSSPTMYSATCWTWQKNWPHFAKNVRAVTAIPRA
jgi:hypothetical protein